MFLGIVPWVPPVSCSGTALQPFGRLSQELNPLSLPHQPCAEAPGLSDCCSAERYGYVGYLDMWGCACETRCHAKGTVSSWTLS